MRAENNRLNPPKEYIPDPRPCSSIWDEKQLAEFINKFEDKETKRWYKAYKKGLGKTKLWEEYDVQETIDYLSSIEEPVPVEAQHDIREAIKIAVEAFRRRKVAETLPVAYEQYLMNIELGIGYDETEKEKFDMRAYYADLILKGRALAGEPENFDF